MSGIEELLRWTQLIIVDSAETFSRFAGARASQRGQLGSAIAFLARLRSRQSLDNLIGCRAAGMCRRASENVSHNRKPRGAGRCTVLVLVGYL